MPAKRTTRRASARRAAASPPANHTETKTTFQWIKVADLHPLYFRAVSKTKVRKIQDPFDPDALGVLYVSARDDGDYYVIDGNNRLAALIEMGYADQKVPAQVYHGLTRAREAALFVEYNRDRTKPKPIDIYLADVIAGTPNAVGVQRVLDARGLEVRHQQGYGKIMAPGALLKVYEHAGAKTLGDTLDILTAAWGGGHTSYHGEIILGLGLVLARYGKAVNQERMAKRLSTRHADILLSDARVQNSVAKGQGVNTGANRSADYVARQMIGLYNGGLRSENRLVWQDRDGRHYWSPAQTAK